MAYHTYTRSHRNWLRIRKRILLILFLCILSVVGFLFYAFRINSFSIALNLLGQEQMFLEYGDPYSDPGVELLLIGTHMFRNGIALDTDLVSLQTSLDDETVGKQELIYSADIFGMHTQCSRFVTVIDSVSPVITLTKDETKRWHIGYTAIDNYDGDISASVRWEESLGRMTFAVMDSSGNPAYIEKNVPFYDIDPPQIELTGGYVHEIAVGEPFAEPGYRSVDNADGVVTDRVLVEGEVNPYVAGTYPITYTVIDSAYNEAKVIRNVEVVAKPRPQVKNPTRKTVYLTFNDGPGPYTMKLLEILDKYNIKATFFVTNSQNMDFLKKIAERGHSIGIHSATNDTSSIYASPEAFYEDLLQMQSIIFEQTGVLTTLMRFPGGSSNAVSKQTYPGIMTLLTQSVQDAGFQYFDWNVDSKDSSSATTASAVANHVIYGIEKEYVSLVRMHDVYEYSVDAVEKIILWGLEHEYTFQALSQTSPGFHHAVRN